MTDRETNVYADLVEEFTDSLSNELKEPVSTFLVLDALASCGLTLSWAQETDSPEKQFQLREALTNEFYSLGLDDDSVSNELDPEAKRELYDAVESALFLVAGEGMSLIEFPSNVSATEMYNQIAEEVN